MSAPWVCLECGARAADAGTCCEEARLDARLLETRELMRDVDLRRREQRERRGRYLGAGVGIVVVVALWAIPGYWTVRAGIGLPFLLDQWLLMAVIGLGVDRLVLATWKPRFPYLDGDALALR